MSTELAYLAGIIDGEGNVSIVKRTTYYVPVVAISNTNETLVLHLKSVLESIGVGFSLSYSDRGQRTNSKPAWTFQIAGKSRVKKLLEMVYPYLVAKRQQTDLVIKWCSKKERRRKLSELDFDMLADIRTLNQRGRVR